MEINELLSESIDVLEKDFYEKKFDFSYSSFSKLLWNPAVFYQLYVMGVKEERQEPHLVQGKIIHALLLEEDKFFDHFIVSPASLPTGNLKSVIDRIYHHYAELSKSGDTRSELEEFDQAILDVLKDMNYHQSLKTDQQRLDKILTEEAKNYWSFLKQREGKTLIDQESYDFCKNAVELVKTDEKICKLIGCNVTEFENKEVFNEHPLRCDINGKSFGIKGLIDNIVIDHDTKVIYINDIKTTSKELKDFKDTVEYYNYWLQGIIYFTLIATNFLNLIEGGYQIKMHFIVIDKTYQVYAFPVSNKTLEDDWFTRFTEIIEKADWHYKNRDYTLPYEFATGKVVL